MKKNQLLIVLLLICYSPVAWGQFQVEIGRDTTYCQCDYENVTLASRLVITGGVEPYSYSWSGVIKKAKSDMEREYPVSSFLNDTTVANPRFINWWSNGIWNQLKLTVTDAEGNVAEDSINIRFSEYLVFPLGEVPVYIDLGDSLLFDLSGIDFGGILPYKSYIWNPQEDLSNPESPQTWCKPKQESRYYCILTDSVGCVAHTSNFWVIVNGGSALFVPNSYCGKVYQSEKTIFFDNPENQEALLQFYNLSGQFIVEHKTKSNHFNPDFDTDKYNILICRVIINDDQQTIKYHIR